MATMTTGNRLRRVVAIAGAFAASIGSLFVATPISEAGIYPSSTDITYKEYWADHTTWTGGCPEHGLFKPGGNGWYLEPGPCAKEISFSIPDSLANATKVELYLDLWRAGRTGKTPFMRYKLNNGPTRAATVGQPWSRTPLIVEIPKSEFRVGINTFVFTSDPPASRGHIHEVGVRAYYSESNPLGAGSGSDVTPPSAVAISGVVVGGTDIGTAGGTLNVDSNSLVLRASASGAAAVEFIGFYEGYDEDNDGATTDWHAFNRNNWNGQGFPSGMPAPATRGTIGHIGTDLTAPYEVTWDMRSIVNQSGVRFKVRARDAAGNVRESVAPGVFSVARSYPVTAHRISNFVDAGLYQGGANPSTYSANISLPSLAGVTKAYVLGNYWQNPFISFNGRTEFLAFVKGQQDTWTVSFKEVPVNHLVAGQNTITWRYNPDQIRFGQFVERPGPMVVLHGGSGPTGTAPAITQQPASVTVTEGQPASFTVVASGTAPLSYQWTRNGQAISGATSATLQVPATVLGDSGSTYRATVTNTLGSATSNPATLTVNQGGGGGTLPLLTVSDESILEGNSGTSSLAFRVRLSAPSATDVTVLASTVSGSASAGVDFLARTSVLVTIPAGQLGASVGVPIRGDTVREANERFRLVLTAATGATVSDGDATGTILNDD
jgi:Immunoglobulin domain/Calx-beta domain